MTRRKSLIVETVDVLRSALEHGVFSGRLPGERKLCEMLSVSRPGQFTGALARIVEKLAQGAVVGGEVRLLVPDLIREQTVE